MKNIPEASKTSDASLQKVIVRLRLHHKQCGMLLKKYQIKFMICKERFISRVNKVKCLYFENVHINKPMSFLRKSFVQQLIKILVWVRQKPNKALATKNLFPTVKHGFQQDNDAKHQT